MELHVAQDRHASKFRGESGAKLGGSGAVTNTCVDLLSHTLVDSVKKKFYPCSISVLNIDPILGAGGIENKVQEFIASSISSSSQSSSSVQSSSYSWRRQV